MRTTVPRLKRFGIRNAAVDIAHVKRIVCFQHPGNPDHVNVARLLFGRQVSNQLFNVGQGIANPGIQRTVPLAEVIVHLREVLTVAGYARRVLHPGHDAPVEVVERFEIAVMNVDCCVQKLAAGRNSRQPFRIDVCFHKCFFLTATEHQCTYCQQTSNVFFIVCNHNCVMSD